MRRKVAGATGVGATARAARSNGSAGPLAVVDGELQGDFEGGRGGLVIVGPHGKCAGTLKAARLRIEGEVRGAVDVETVIEVLPQGRLTARVERGRLATSPGAVVDLLEAPNVTATVAAPAVATAPTFATKATSASPPSAKMTAALATAAPSTAVKAAAAPAAPSTPVTVAATATPTETRRKVAFKGGYQAWP